MMKTWKSITNPKTLVSMSNAIVRAADVMVTDLITLNITESMDKAEAIFKQHKIHHIPIVDNEGCLLGVVGTSDLNKILHGKTLFKSQNVEAYNNALLRTLLVSEVMVENPIIVEADQPLSDVIDLFKQNLFRSIPVVTNKKAVGIITPIDLIKVLEKCNELGLVQAAIEQKA